MALTAANGAFERSIRAMRGVMPVSNAIRRLTAKWESGSGWPKKLEWVEVKGLRGWTGQRFELRYPIMAVTGENGVGKSTVLQAAASVYDSLKQKRFASD